MKFVFIDDIKSGMILGEDVLSDYNTVVFKEGHILSDCDLDAIRKFGILMVKIVESNVFEGSLDEKDLNNKSFERKYLEIVNSYRNIFEKYEKIDVKAIENISNLIIDMINNSQGLLKILNSIRAKGFDVFRHCVNVAIISYLISSMIGIEKSEREKLVKCGLLHDIGFKCLSKDTTGIDIVRMEKDYRHPYISCERINGIDKLEKSIIMGILDHHERLDGSGFPRGIKSKEINTFARIIGIADIYDKSTVRHGAKESSPFKALERIIILSYGQLDVMIVNSFVKAFLSCSLGQKVLLSDGREGDIIYINKFEKLRPLIKSNREFVDLYNDATLDIIDFI